MNEDNIQAADDSTENSNSADSFFAPEVTAESITKTSSRNKWIIPGAAIASTALLSGLLGFTIGNHSGPELRPAFASEQMAPGQGGPGMGLPGMDGDRDGGMNDNHKGRGMHGQSGPGMPGMMPGGPQNGNGSQPGMPGMMPGGPQNGNGSQPGMPGMPGKGGQLPAPAPSATSSAAIQ